MGKKEKLSEENRKGCCGEGRSSGDGVEQNHECGCGGEGGCGCGTCECEGGEMSEVDALKAALALSQEEARKNHDNWLRSMADLDTFRRRMQRDMEDIRKFSIQPFAEALLPSIDNLELGLDHAKKGESAKDLIVGIEMVLGQIKRVFAEFGITEISPLGEDFDPNSHEAVSHEPSDKYPENKVSSIMRKGYSLNGRLIRPASVVVSSGAKKD